MLPHKDFENVLRINRAAASLKPILQQTLLYLHNSITQPSSRLEKYHPGILASTPINEATYRNWNQSRGTVASRVTPVWGPLDRTSLGLILREVGSNLYQPSVILSCSELILESLLMTNLAGAPADAGAAPGNDAKRFEELIDLLKEMILRNRMKGEKQDTSFAMNQVDQLILQSKRLIELIDFGIQELALSSEFERPFVFTGHDVKKVFRSPHLLCLITFL
jgi:hypothetical protein